MTATRRTFLTSVGCAGLLGFGAASTSGESSSTDLTRDSFTIMSGTDRETTVYVTSAAESGPTVLVVGGMHGNEEAGYLAAEKIRDWDIQRGTLVTIPRANAAAVEADRRSTVDGYDLNRQFPTGSTPETELARAIWGVVEEYDPDEVLDLHESMGIWDGDMIGGVGQTIFRSWNDEAETEAPAAAEYLNENFVSRDGYEFTTAPFSSSDSEPTGLFAHKAARDADAVAYLAEVTSQDTPTSKRIEWHQQLTRQLVEDELFASTSGSGDEEEGSGDEQEGSGDEEEGSGDEQEGSGDGEKEQNEPPVARIRTSPSTAGDEPLDGNSTITFDASPSADPDGDVVNYRWDVPADGTFDRTGRKTRYTPRSCGEFTARLEVEDEDGATDTASVTVTIS